MTSCFYRPLFPDEVLRTNVGDLQFLGNGLVQNRLDRILLNVPIQALLVEALAHFPVYPFMSLGEHIKVDLLEFIKVSHCCPAAFESYLGWKVVH